MHDGRSVGEYLGCDGGRMTYGEGCMPANVPRSLDVDGNPTGLAAPGVNLTALRYPTDGTNNSACGCATTFQGPPANSNSEGQCVKLNTVPDSFGLDDARGWYVYLTKCELAIASSPPGPPPLPPLVAAGLTSAPVVSLPGNSTPLTPGLAFLTVPFF